jgi:hypothetical protein
MTPEPEPGFETQPVQQREKEGAAQRVLALSLPFPTIALLHRRIMMFDPYTFIIGVPAFLACLAYLYLYNPDRLEKVYVRRLLKRAELMGSRGRARYYGRPEPEGRDYDWIIFTDDYDELTTVKALMAKLLPLRLRNDYRWIERYNGVTVTNGVNDISVYPEYKRLQIKTVWRLQEHLGMDKDQAWERVANTEFWQGFVYAPPQPDPVV